jgi:hypothetical protein
MGADPCGFCRTFPKLDIFFIIVDAHSKMVRSDKDSRDQLIQSYKVLRNIFASNGFPSVMVSDNGPQFTSEEFKRFTRANGIKHVTSSIPS